MIRVNPFITRQDEIPVHSFTFSQFLYKFIYNSPRLPHQKEEFYVGPHP